MKPTTQIIDLATQANAAHRTARAAVAGALEHARQAGEALNKAKAAVPHGQWAAWIGQHVEFSERTARAYIRLARGWPALNGQIGNAVTDLSLRIALRSLATPKRGRPEIPSWEGSLPADHPPTAPDEYAPLSEMELDGDSELLTVLPNNQMVWISPSVKVPGYYYVEWHWPGSDYCRTMRKATESFLREHIAQWGVPSDTLWKRFVPPGLGPEFPGQDEGDAQPSE